MNQPVFSSPMPATPIDVQQLVDDIIRTFTPMAFQCACNGSDPNCAKVRETDRWAIAQADTVRRIADHIRSVSLVTKQSPEGNAIERVRDLHKPQPHHIVICDPETCLESVCQECLQDYPCPTISALGGDIDTAKPNKSNISTSDGELE